LTEWHWLTALLGFLFLGAALALYGVEKEEEARSTVRVLAKKAHSDLREVLRFNGHSASDVLILEIEIRFLNAGDKLRRIRFPTIELQRKDNRRWQTLPLTDHSPQAFARMHQRGLPNVNEIWDRDQPFNMPPVDELTADFSMIVTSPEGSRAFIGRDLRLRVGVEIIGQERPNVINVPVAVKGYTT
jgi:hypothetical protein